MPYAVRSKQRFSNQWFSSSDGQTVEEMRDLLSEANIDALEERGGVCIVYTHFASGFVDERGRLDPTFERRIAYLASKRGWFVQSAPYWTICPPRVRPRTQDIAIVFRATSAGGLTG